MKYTRKTLPNGLRIITVPMKDTQTAIAMVLVEAGSHYEDKRVNGISHFLEHMCFKGTKNRNSKELIEELDGMGAESNAFTSEQVTGYWAKVHHKRLPQVLDIVSDIYLHSIFPEEEMEKEKGVIIEEINMYEDMPQRTVYNLIEELMYGDQPAGRTVLGPAENIKKMKRDDFVEYYSQHYVPEKTTVIVAGNISEKDVLNQAKELFKDVQKSKGKKLPPVVEKQKAAQCKIKYKKNDQTHLVFGFRTFGLGDKNNPTADVLATILGQGMSSRLFSKMREELGICYYTGAFHYALEKHGAFFMRAGVVNNRAEEAVAAMMEEARKLTKEKVEPKELQKAKQYLNGTTAIGLESSDAIAYHYGLQEIHHRDLKKPAEYYKKVRAVTSEQVLALAKKIFKTNNTNLAMIAPHKDEARFKKLLKF